MVHSQLKSGRTSAPRLPQARQMNRGSRSDILTSSGHLIDSRTGVHLAMQRPQRCPSLGPFDLPRAPPERGRQPWRPPAGENLFGMKTSPGKRNVSLNSADGYCDTLTGRMWAMALHSDAMVTVGGEPRRPAPRGLRRRAPGVSNRVGGASLLHASL
jgi:hypothetical protein